MKLLALAALAVVTMCSSCTLLTTDCASDLRITPEPADTSLVVGQRFTADVHLYECHGQKELNAVLRWSAEDSTVVRVDSISGVVTARAPGRSTIFAQATNSVANGRYQGPIVTVR